MFFFFRENSLPRATYSFQTDWLAKQKETSTVPHAHAVPGYGKGQWCDVDFDRCISRLSLKVDGRFLKKGASKGCFNLFQA